MESTRITYPWVQFAGAPPIPTSADIIADGPSVPEYAHDGDAGFDLRAHFTAQGSYVLRPGARALVATGLRLALPESTVGLICPRSGLAMKYGVTVLNAPGVIDSNYRGEIKVLLINFGDEDFEIHSGDRIAQMVIAPYAGARFTAPFHPDATSRGTGGFGSTGVS